MPADTRRDARNSRENSASNNNPRGLEKDKIRGKSMNGTLDGWVEPSLAAKPSFEDHGGAPYGVLEGMQALGERPSARVRARVKGDGARKSLLGRSGGAAGLDAQGTPEGTPGPQFSSQSALDLPPLPPIAMDDEDDDDYAPGKKSKKKERAVKPRAASKRQSESAGPPAEAPPPPPKNKGGRPKKVVDKPMEQKPAVPADDVINVNRVYTPEKLKEVVEEAKKRALETNKLVLYGAVEEIYQQSLSSRRLTELLEAILCVTATKEQMAEFQTYVKTAKKKLRRAKNEVARNSSAAADATTNGDKPLPVRSPAKNEKVTQVKDESPALPSTEKAEPPKPKFSIKVKSPQKSANKKHDKTALSSTVKNKTEDMDDDGNASELSELTELSEGEEMAVDTPEELDEMSAGPSGRINGIKVKDQAAERGSLGVQGSNLKRSSADAEIHETEDDRALSAKKLKLSNTVKREYDYQDSHVRSSLNGLSRPSRGPGAKNNAAAPPRITLQPNGGGNVSSRGSRAISVDADSPLSSPAGSSRRSTPHVWKGPPKPTGKRAKTKTSPDKKHQHSYGGMPGAGGAGRDSPIGDDDNEESSENNDFCSSCGGNGYLLCCDGCDRAFHFTCLDPPIKDEASELNEPWFCFICVAKRPISVEQPEKPARGLFAPLLNTLNKTNPRTFQLPEYIRNYFEGVGTAANGEFTEAVKTKTRKTEEKIDDLKTKDSKGNIVICYACSKSSLGKRSIITCDYCNQHWHLDCLDPPLANIPNRDPLGNKKSDWMCPLHVDHELRQVDTRLLKPAFSSRRVHIRKPRQAKTAETALQRGLQNNGIIEIADDDSDDTDSEFYEDDREPTVYKMPASGIKLDFIDKIKQTRIQEHQEARLHKRIKLDHATNAPGALGQANFARRPFRDQHTALSLVQFANANPDLDLGGDRLENLLGTVISEAPEQVVDDIAAAEGQKTPSNTNGFKASPSPPNSQTNEPLSPEHRRELEILQELIKRKLEGSKP